MEQLGIVKSLSKDLRKRAHKQEAYEGDRVVTLSRSLRRRSRRFQQGYGGLACITPSRIQIFEEIMQTKQ